MRPLTPKSKKAEWHLTYRCNLKCKGCNRLCYLPPTTDDMTLDDALSFVQQAKEMHWKPHIYLLGGEPTLHEDLREFCIIARMLNPSGVTVVSNGWSDESKQILREIEDDDLAEISETGKKPNGAVEHKMNFQVAPVDLGWLTGPCRMHSRFRDGCGISVDHVGYTVCCVGGAIDSVLQFGIRAPRLKDIFTRAVARRQTNWLCRHCGAYMKDWESSSKVRRVKGWPMTKTWRRAVHRIIKNA